MAFEAYTAASFTTGILSNYMQLQAGLDESAALEVRASRYKFKAKRSRLAAEAAKTQTKLNNTILQEEFNETQALQAAQFSIQGRSGSTIANIISRDQENLNWDKEFMKLSGIIQETGFELEALGYEQDAAAMEISAARRRRGAYTGAGIGFLGQVTNTMGNM